MLKRHCTVSPAVTQAGSAHAGAGGVGYSTMPGCYTPSATDRCDITRVRLYTVAGIIPATEARRAVSDL